MPFYDDPKNAEDYIKMAKGYDGTELIAILDKQLSEGASILELGMGPGVILIYLPSAIRSQVRTMRHTSLSGTRRPIQKQT